MTIETISGTSFRYYLIAYDKEGREREDDPDGRMSDVVRRTITGEQSTDVFILSHGWKGDIPAAREQFDRWLGAMMALEKDHEAARARRPGFRPLLIGLHWPSLPFGDEDFDPAGTTFSAPGQAQSIDALVDRAAARTADTPAARAALKAIFEASRQNALPDTLPAEVRRAYVELNAQMGLGSLGESPGDDREPFDPTVSFADARDEPIAFGGGVSGTLLSPLVQLSFWKMKDRARAFGETGAADLLAMLMTEAGSRDVRFHLMGHSFGCIALSGAVASRDGAPLPRPVHSMVLVQGALSLWSYCATIPHRVGKPGYFHRILADRRVAGTILTTRSERDLAVGKLYPAGAGVARQVTFGLELPKYGGVGAYGLRGEGLKLRDVKIQAQDHDYQLLPGEIVNVECTRIISEGGPPSGAHSDIAKPEIAHLIWEAAR